MAPPSIKKLPTTTSTPVLYSKTYGNTVTVFEDVVYGNTYTFSTCNSNNGDYSKFDTVIVLRSPDGNALSANDNCPPPNYCSSITYTHSDYSFDKLYLSVYQKSFSQSRKVYLCNDSSAQNTRFFGYIYASLTTIGNGITNCDFNLVCKNKVTFDQGDKIAFDDFIDWKNSDLCGITSSDSIPFTYDNSQITSMIVDCEFGESSVEINIFGSSCSSESFINPPSYSLSCGSSSSVTYPNSFLSSCVFGRDCDIDPSYYIPDVDATGSCGYDGYEISVETNEVGAMVGDIVTFDITANFSNGAVASKSCVSEVLGIVPQSLFGFDIDTDGYAVLPSDPVYLNNDDSIYFDTIYRLNFLYDLEDIQNGFELYVVKDPLGSLLAENNFQNFIPKFQNVEEENCDRKREVGDCLNCCTGYIDFCIPSSDKINNDGDNEGIFQSNLHYNLIIANQKQNSKKSSVNAILDDFVISLGNPLVILSDNPKHENLSPDCTAFQFLHEQPVCGGMPQGWDFSDIYEITENSGSSLIDFIVIFDIDTQTLINAGAMNSNGDDIRFGYNNGAVLLNYWIESGINTANTKIWVKVDDIPASSKKTIFMYYGNSLAPPVSSSTGILVGPFSSTNQVKSGSPGGAQNSQRGFEFVPKEDVLVTSFGKYEPTGTTRYVTLFDVSSRAILEQIQVSGPQATYTYAPLQSPRWLIKDTIYTIQLYQGVGDGYYFGPSSQINSHLTYNKMLFCNSCTQDTFPTNFLTNYHYGVPDFEFYVKPTLVSPAPTYSLTCSTF